jgi:hypothetical protein
VTPPLRIALLGLGEAGDAIARDLVVAGADVSGYDPNVSPLPEGVREFGSEAKAVAGADVVLSVNSSHDAMTALVNAQPGLSAGTIWADLNTASPGIKVALANQLAGTGVSVVDVALMSPVPGNGLRTPMLVSGDAATRYADLLGGLGANVTVQPGPVAEAISRKLLRSVFYKGLAASVVEAWPPRRPPAALTGSPTASARSWPGSTRPGPAGRRYPPARQTPRRRDDGGSRAACRAWGHAKDRGRSPRPARRRAGSAGDFGMIIDCHGHYTVEQPGVAGDTQWRPRGAFLLTIVRR